MKKLYSAREQITRGKYNQGTNQLREVYEKVYEIYGLSPSQATPSNLLSVEWSWAFGHLGNAAVYLRMRELEGDSRNHVLFAENQNFGNQLLKLIERRHHVSFLQDGEQKWSIAPSFWPFVQQQDILFLGDGRWIRPERYYDTFYPKLKEAYSPPPLSLELAEIIEKKNLLRKIGVESSEWFCTLHVRSSNDDSIRNQDISDYLEAIKYINSKQGLVFLLGSSADVAKIERPGLIDLRHDRVLYSEIQPYLISQSRFMIGSSGGPIIMPKVFGVPSLITNIVNLGWCATSGPNHTYYLPKTLVRNNSVLSYAESLACDITWGDFKKSWLKDQSLELRNNKPSEILEAVAFMIEATNPDRKIEEYRNKDIDRARSEFEWVASGSIVPTFLEENPWYTQ